MSPTSIVAYIALFAAVGFLTQFAALVLGRLLRPQRPSPGKQAIYECGEPAIGSSYVQFDLRFYVVALVFIIFDVEVAFFFPWATVYGKATELMAKAAVSAGPAQEDLGPSSASAVRVYRELEGTPPASDGRVGPATAAEVFAAGRTLALCAMADMGVFFGVLMVGFIYVWYRGDLNWVRALAGQATGQLPRGGESPAG